MLVVGPKRPEASPIMRPGQCSTFTGMRDLRESDHQPKRIKSGGFPDTYYFTIAELHAAGLAKDCIISKIQEFEGQLKVQFDKELAEMQQPVEEAKP